MVAVTDRVDRTEIGAWCDHTFTSLHSDLTMAGVAPAGPGGALYSEQFFTEAVGEVTAYVPATVPEAYPPSPLATSHSFVRARSISMQVSRGIMIIGG